MERRIKTPEDIEEQKNRIIRKALERTRTQRDRAKNAEQEAATDTLTGLATRRIFDARLHELKSQKDRARSREVLDLDTAPSEQIEKDKKENAFSLLFIDIDHFKQINDTYGHGAGDEVLKKIATIIDEELRLPDVVARYGGEEFVVLVDDASEQEARIVAERIQSRIREATIQLPEHSKSIRITASIGLAEYGATFPAEALTHRADQALYFSKEHGRNMVASWENPEVQEWAEERQEKEIEKKHAKAA